MKAPIPVNPEVLKWARVSLNLSLEEVAHKLKKDPAVIEAWERGDGSPSYAQLESLAYTMYKRPVALFFFPEPPEEPPLKKDFRTLPDAELEKIPPRILYLLRRARFFQTSLAELYGDKNPSSQFILRLMELTTGASLVKTAREVRQFLGAPVEKQPSFSDSDEAFKFWRNLLEEHGIFVFKDSFNSKSKKTETSDLSFFSGFCLYDKNFPVIYINNGLPRTRQVFTLFHELAHLLFQTGGIDAGDEVYIPDTIGDNQKIEIFCNQFAAEILVPSDHFSGQIAGKRVDEILVSDLSKKYAVSREVILRRLLDRNLVSGAQYSKLVNSWRTQKGKKEAGGGDHYLNQGVYLGPRYIGKVLSHYRQGSLTAEQAADYLNAKVNQLDSYENWLALYGGLT